MRGVADFLGDECARLRTELAKVTEVADMISKTLRLTDSALRASTKDKHVLAEQLAESNRERDAAMWAHAKTASENMSNPGGSPRWWLRILYPEHAERLIAEREAK